MNHRFFQYVLFPFSLIFGFIVRVRNLCYDRRIFRSFKIEGCTVISVGNISAGGTGKTPVIKFLALYLKEQNLKVAILSRGYGRKSKGTVIVSDGENINSDSSQSGDEPLLLARQLRGIPVVVEADRYKGARLILEQFRPDVILLDDGFQHRRLARDFDIALVDASVGFGREFLLPAGFLREPVSSLKRADLIWLTRTDQSKNVQALNERIREVTDVEIVESVHEADALISARTGDIHSLDFLRDKKAFLFSGIANANSFERTVKNYSPQTVQHIQFSDHYKYSRADIDKIVQKSNEAGADLIVTTEKDFVKLADFTGDWENVFYLTINIKITGGTPLEKTTFNEIFSQNSSS